MGRIFETRKATMFARWDKMAKVFTRVSKDIAIAVKAGGPRRREQPRAAPRAAERARGRTCPRTRSRPPSSAPAARTSRPTRWSSTRATAPHGDRRGGRDRDRQRGAHGRQRADALQGPRRQPGHHRQRRLPVPEDGRVPAAPQGLDLEALELDLIDHGLEEMGEGKGEKGEPPGRSSAAPSPSFGQLQAAIEERKLPLLSAESEYVAQNPVELPEEQAQRGARAGGRARAGRGRPAGVPQPGVASAAFSWTWTWTDFGCPTSVHGPRPRPRRSAQSVSIVTPPSPLTSFALPTLPFSPSARRTEPSAARPPGGAPRGGPRCESAHPATCPGRAPGRAGSPGRPWR